MSSATQDQPQDVKNYLRRIQSLDKPKTTIKDSSCNISRRTGYNCTVVNGDIATPFIAKEGFQWLFDHFNTQPNDMAHSGIHVPPLPNNLGRRIQKFQGKGSPGPFFPMPKKRGEGANFVSANVPSFYHKLPQMRDALDDENSFRNPQNIEFQ